MITTYEILGHRTGTLADMHAEFEIRDDRGWLIGYGFARYGWDGEQPIDGWVDDPWQAAHEAISKAIPRVRAIERALFTTDLPLFSFGGGA
jgi:hypothetical protein